MKKQVFNPSQTVIATVIEGPSEFEMPLVHQAFVPFHNLWGINSCFLRGAFDLDIETLEAGCTSGSPVVASGQQMAGFLQFPDLPGLCDWLRSRGFVPGLWFGFPYVSKGSPLLQERPDLFDLKTGTELQWEDAAPSKSVWLRPSPALTEHFRNVLAPFVAMGFRKFKLDFFGGPRAAMIGIVRCAHEAIVSLDPTIEIEGHHPDIFYSRWVDAVRVHDVILHNGWDWQGLTLAHLRVTELCCPDRLVNLDHGGGNIYLYGNPQLRVMPSEEDYIRHLRMFDLYDNVPRYPVLSLLPDHYGPAARHAVGEYLQRHNHTKAAYPGTEP